MTKKWLKAADVRAIKTVAQTAAATIGTAAMINNVDWRAAIRSTRATARVSVLTSVGGLPEVTGA